MTTSPRSPGARASAQPAADAAEPDAHRSWLTTSRNAVMRGLCRLAGCETSPSGPEVSAAGGGVSGATELPSPVRKAPDGSAALARGAGAGDAVVRAEGLTKRYPDGTIGARDVDVQARPGEIVAFVGPNGAGKSTTLNMLAGLLRPSSGHGTIHGVPITDRRRLGAVVGVGLQSSGLDVTMTAREHLECQAGLYGLARERATGTAAGLLNELGLMAHVDRRVGRYSGGMQRRLVLALALLHDPPVLILDEPTAGLDPQSRRVVRSLLQAQRDAGRTVLFSTQMLEEADLLADAIYVIADGQIIAEGPPRVLREAYGSLSLRVRVLGDVEDVARFLVGKLPHLGAPRIDADQLSWDTGDGPGDTARLTAALDEYAVDFLELSVGRPSLEEAFVRLTGADIRTEPLVDNSASGGTISRCC